MAAPQLPDRFRGVLAGSSLEHLTLELADAVGVVLKDNETPFFPAFTDHGPVHVERVLLAASRLIPDDAWEAEILNAADVAVLTSAVMLHDLAMHVREVGFAELVHPDSHYAARPWFADDHVGRGADRAWPELWASFQQEARHFGTSQIEVILGPHGSQVPDIAHAGSLEPDNWTLADRLLIGEFLRRHHARLSHEIALYGLPGVENTSFPRLGDTMPELAEPIGAVARSHNEPLRLMFDYLEYLEPGNKRPAGVLAHFHMGLLRTADYLQIEATRAPPLLMRLKSIQSPRSIEEWNKHGAVSSVTWDHADPFAIFVTVSPHHGLRTHLALGDLFDDLQHEMDTTTSALSETYGSTDLALLRLARQRVLSNLDEPSLHATLPYLPQRAALRSDADLFRLVIQDLYGNEPAVAGRELIQNAVDAVRARDTWEREGGAISGAVRELEADVAVTLEENADGRCVLRIADRGIGMTPSLVIDYFLKAGASFGPTSIELEGKDRDELVGMMKAGRFGVGAFAAFLLGQEMQVTTRHVESERALSFTARVNEDLVQIKWADAPIGTEVAIPFAANDLPLRRWSDSEERVSPKELLNTIASFYRLRYPKVSYRFEEVEAASSVSAPADIPPPGRRLPDRWRSVTRTTMDALLWQVPRQSFFASDHFLAHNGVVIRDLSSQYYFDESVYEWSELRLREILRTPSLAVFDSRHLLSLALHRYGLVNSVVPFEKQLLESIGLDTVAHGVVEGPMNHPLQDAESFSPVFSSTTWMPLFPALLRRYVRKTLLVLWKPDRLSSWVPDHPQNVDKFLNSKSPIAWRQFPHRTAITAEVLGSDAHDISEIQDWGHPIEALREAEQSWGRRLGAEALATVVVRGNAPSTSGVPEVVGGQPDFADWRSFGQAAGDPGVFLAGEDAAHPEIEKRLIEAGLKFQADGHSPSIALTAFGGFSLETDRQEQLAAAWVRTFGGGMPRGPRTRRDIADSLTREDRTLGPLINKWRRSAEDTE